MIMRNVQVRAETANDETKSVEVIIASENPVERYDEQRKTVIREILRMDGVEFRTDRRQLPIVDSHDRSTVRNVLGSVRNGRTENGQLVGDAIFARDEDSQIAYQKLKDGHLTDFSITATPVESMFIPRGAIQRINGVDIEGPAEVITKWIPTDASLVAAGADETSTVRQLMRSYNDIPNLTKELKRMLTDEMHAALVAKGMPEQITDAEQAIAWAVGVLGSAEMPTPEPEVIPVTEEITSAEDEPMPEDEPKDEAAIVDRALKADRVRRREILALCTKAKIERAFADTLVDEGVSLNVARQKVLERMIEQKPVGATRIETVASSDDKFAAAMGAGLIQRAARGAGVKVETPKAEGAEDFSRMNLLRMAEKWLQRGGVNTDRMSNQDIALAAMGSPSVMRRYNIQRDAYHTTGSFSNLMLDAANKTLIQAYEEAPYTWSMWARQGNSVNDFKNINRIRFSESPNLEQVPEGQVYKEKAFSDQKETYTVSKYGALFTVTWETVVNDDLDAISRVPAMHGNAARRKQNQVVYDVLTANATMSDGVALFGPHESGTNLDASGAAPSVSELNAAFVAMMTQKGLSLDAIINVQPRYFIVPAAVSATALELVNSTSYVLANSNSGVQNIYGVNGQRPLQVIVEPYLDGNSSTAWYLAADPSQIDTVELSFLAGEESPVLENEWDFDSDCYKYKIRQTFGAKAIDWRGLFKNPGA